MRGSIREPDLYMYSRRLSTAEVKLFLSVIFDHRLIWLPHLRDFKAAYTKQLSFLRVLSHLSLIADRTHLHMYLSLIMSKLEYGCQLYYSAPTPRLLILDSIYHAEIRLATGAFQSCPIPILKVVAGVLPLDLHNQILVARSWHRSSCVPDSPMYITFSGNSLVLIIFSLLTKDVHTLSALQFLPPSYLPSY